MKTIKTLTFDALAQMGHRITIVLAHTAPRHRIHTVAAAQVRSSRHLADLGHAAARVALGVIAASAAALGQHALGVRQTGARLVGRLDACVADCG